MIGPAGSRIDDRPMSDEPQTISSAPPDEPGADYAKLRERAIELTRAMAPVWSDYNYSDPGVTIIEQLCYALTELPYRASLPVGDLLVGPLEGRVKLKRQGLKAAWSILPCNPVTVNDLRRLVIDRVPDVANVWFTPARPDAQRGLSGLYDVAVLALGDERSLGEGCCGTDRLIEKVGRCYRAHRAVGEDIRETRLLSQLDCWVFAQIQIEDGTDASKTLAQALFNLGLALAPEPRRHSLDEEMAGGKTTASVFDGPLMLRGFIADDQLTPLPSEVQVDRLAGVLAETQGILAVDTISVGVDGTHHRYGRGETIPVAKNHIPWLQGTSREGRFTIELRRRTTRVIANPGRVRRILERLWAEHRRTYPLRAEYAERFGAPKATYRDLSVFTSVQRQFPNVYGIGPSGLPREASPMRQAQARQMKGYLMVFDQLLADYFAQMASMRDLFSIEAGGKATYAWQSLRGIVPDAAPLLLNGYEEGLAAIVAAGDPVLQRRNMILDLLLSLYARRVTDPEQNQDRDSVGGVLRIKQAMLRHIDGLGRDRGRGADYRRRPSLRSMSGVERSSRLELGLPQVAPAGPDGHAGRGGRIWGAAQDPVEGRFGRPMPADMDAVLDQLFHRIDRIGDGPAATGPSPLEGRTIAEELAAALDDPSRYRVGRSAPSAAAVYLLCVDARGGWWWLGEYVDEEKALEAVRQLLRDQRGRQDRSRDTALYIVDWILLRAAMLADAHSAHRFNFRVTAVISAQRDGWDEETWRRHAEQVVRTNTPAHIALDCLFLPPRAMRHFERLFRDWQDTMRGCSTGRQIHACKALADYLTFEIDGPPPKSSPLPSPPPPTDDQPAPRQAPSPPTPTPAPPPPSPSLTPEPEPEPASAPTPEATPTAVPDLPPPPPPLASLPLISSGRLVSDGHASGIGGRIASFWQDSVLPVLRKLAFWRSKPNAAGKDEEATPPASAAPPPAPVEEAPPAAPAAPAARAIPPTEIELPGTVAAAPDQAIGVDLDTVLTGASAATFAEAGFRFAIRYLPRAGASSSGDLTAAEATTILNAGLALMAVQHVAAEGWTPSGPLGASNGEQAADDAWSIGLPPGLSVWLDLEGVAAGTPDDAVIAYCNAWYGAVAACGYVPGLYVGADCGLGASQITATAFGYFWQSGSTTPALSTGYCMVQSISSSYVLDGIAYDLDVVQNDAQGQTPFWLSPS